ncbi:MAG: selenide, water dikinase SelD [Planctomycetota bacterium]
MKPVENAQLVCISNFPIATYSGMMPGVLAGQYSLDQMHIDLVRLCASAGARLILSEVTGIDHENNEIHFLDRPKLAFDLLSIGIGSRPTFQGVNIQSPEALVAVKPMQTFLGRLKSRMENVSEIVDREKRAAKIMVVGGGIGSLEIAFALKNRIQNDPASVGIHFDVDIDILTGSQQMGTGLLESTQALVSQKLTSKGIGIHAGSRVAEISEKCVTLKNGNDLPADAIIWATSAVAPETLSKFAMQTDSKGFLLTESTLQTKTNPNIFAVGDTGTIESSPLVKAGVYAVRQGPVLWDNIRRMILGRSPVNYVPQTGFLKLINLADGNAIAEYKNRSFAGRWCWWLKDRIDVKFMRMYQDYSLMEMKPEPIIPEESMRCLGCGGKIGSQLLSQVIQELDVPEHQDVVIGLSNPDDAAVIKTYNNRVTATTDFFASPFDDPYLVGRIALLNSASDCFVMGAQPTAALAVVQLPLGHPRAQLQVMRELMAGSVDELKKMGATIVGGHSIEGPRLTIGYTILGKQVVEPITKGMLHVGDDLILSKPLGTGILLAGLMQGKLPGLAYKSLIDAMTQSNQIVLKLIQDFQVTAATDVTGFGLAGHLAEMMVASGKSATLSMGRIPLLPACQDLVQNGIESTLAPDNRLVAGKVRITGADTLSPELASLFDPQTGGGLLLGVPKSKSSDVLNFLMDHGFVDSAVIGEVTQSPDSDGVSSKYKSHSHVLKIES